MHSPLLTWHGSIGRKSPGSSPPCAKCLPPGAAPPPSALPYAPSWGIVLVSLQDLHPSLQFSGFWVTYAPDGDATAESCTWMPGYRRGIREQPLSLRRSTNSRQSRRPARSLRSNTYRGDLCRQQSVSPAGETSCAWKDTVLPAQCHGRCYNRSPGKRSAPRKGLRSAALARAWA